MSASIPNDEFMLTTVDNPWNPFTNFEEWLTFDRAKGYNTLSLLARLTVISDSMSDAQEAFEIDQAMNEIVKINPTGLHRKVSRKNFETK